jgi:arylformamidase
MLIRISRPLEQGSPLYPGTPPPVIARFRSIEEGDSSSSSIISFHTHSGTHIDAPRHFCPGAAAVSDLLGAESIFTGVTILHIPRAGDACIAAGDLEPFLPQIHGAHAILIRTGDCMRRDRDPQGYATVHPWIHPAVPDLLRRNIPSLKLFGVDTISISTPAHREEGRACHRAFLCGLRPILLMEDIDLSDTRLSGGGWSLHMYPWLLEALDGIPVTAIAERPEGEGSPVP